MPSAGAANAGARDVIGGANMFDLLIRNGRVVSADAVVEADVAVEGERIAGLLKTAEPVAARRVIDATGLYVVPGGIDAHVHFDMEFLGRSKHTFESGTIAAAFGGTTTVIDFTLDLEMPKGSLMETVERRRARAEGRAVIDFAFHCVVNSGAPATLAELEQVVAYGIPSFKFFTVYREANLYVDDATLYNSMVRLRDLGGIAAVHTENADIVEHCTASLLAAGQRTPPHYPRSRPAFTEVECIRRVIFLARTAGAGLYVVHIAAAGAVDAVRAARAEGQPVYGETCPHYLLLTEAMYARPDGYNYVMSPPLRTEADNEALWRGLAGGWLATVSSDDNSIDVEDKRAGAESFDRASPGCVDVETRIPLLLSEGVRRRQLPITRMVEVAATNPARIFGLHPRKGVLAAGSDADIVLIDPEARLRVSPPTLHMQVQYSPYDGWDVVGLPVMTISRGTIVVERGRFVGRPGHGRFLRRTIDPAVLRAPT
jgi:dihydropyrimidinase